MHDLHLLLTPFLALGVMSVVRFVGCGGPPFTSTPDTPEPAVAKPLVSDVPAFGTTRNDFSGWAGMVIQLGTSDITVDGLGRYCISGNNQTHQVKIVDALTGLDVPGAIVVVDMAVATPNDFAVESFNPVNLSANGIYFVVSQEKAGGDEFCDWPTTVDVDPGWPLTVTSAVYGDPDATPPIKYDTQYGGPNHSYGPVQVTKTTYGP